MSMIGKRFNDAGLQDILIESDVVAQGSIIGVMTGHQYNRSILIHKLMYEELQRLRFRRFLESLSDEVTNSVKTLLTEINNAYQTSSFTDMINHDDFVKLQNGYDTFLNEQSAVNPQFAFRARILTLFSCCLLS